MQHFYQNIQGWFNCEPLYKRMVEEAKDGATFVEVGVWKGKSAAFMGVEIINSGKDIVLYAIDNFQGGPELQNDPSVAGQTLFQECMENLSSVADVVRVLPMSSIDAVDIVEDGTVDFIYIDGSHEYDSVKADILAWLPKVKIGGVMAGDDYSTQYHLGVKRAVDEIFPAAVKQGVVWIYTK